MQIHHKLTHIVDSLLTQREATQQLSVPISITWYTNRTNTQSILHSHPYYELILPVNGDVMYSINGSLIHLHVGELIILPAEVFHYGKYDISDNISERLLAQIDQTLWDSMSYELSFSELSRLRAPIVLNSRAVSDWGIRSLFERMDLLRNVNDENNRDKLCKAMLSTLMVYLMENLHSQDSNQPLGNRIVEQAIRYIQEQFTDSALTVAHIANHTYTSREHLSRLFKRYTMESIHRYITELRMQYFHQQLREGKSIMDSCINSGFSDYSSFTRSFRRIHGMSPSQYLKSLK